MKLSADEDPLKSNTAKTVRKSSVDVDSVPMRETRQRNRIVTTSCRSQQVPASILVGAEVDSRVCIIYDEQMMHHRPSSFHYERPERIHAIMHGLKADGLLQRCALYESERASLKHLADVHTDGHIISIIKETIANKIKGNSDMYFSKGSENAIFMAAGGAVKASFMVATGKHDYAFAVVRPPGHHASAGKESGFCYFNNVAVAAKYLIRDHNMAKILIFDWDIHFGDGTSEIFYEDKNVLVVSMHRSDESHTSFLTSKLVGAEKIGSGEGLGYNCNICWKEPNITDDDFCAAMDYIVLPLATEFKPDMILISAGFDAAIDDPIGDCKVSKFGYATVLNKLMELNKGVVLILEGGYNLDVTSECSSSCVKVLLGDKSEVKNAAEYFPLESTWNAVLELRELLKPQWTNVFTSEVPEEVLAKIRKPEDDVRLPQGAKKK